MSALALQRLASMRRELDARAQDLADRAEAIARALRSPRRDLYGIHTTAGELVERIAILADDDCECADRAGLVLEGHR